MTVWVIEMERDSAKTRSSQAIGLVLATWLGLTACGVQSSETASRTPSVAQSPTAIASPVATAAPQVNVLSGRWQVVVKSAAAEITGIAIDHGGDFYVAELTGNRIGLNPKMLETIADIRSELDALENAGRCSNVTEGL